MILSLLRVVRAFLFGVLVTQLPRLSPLVLVFPRINIMSVEYHIGGFKHSINAPLFLCMTCYKNSKAVVVVSLYNLFFTVVKIVVWEKMKSQEHVKLCFFSIYCLEDEPKS